MSPLLTDTATLVKDKKRVPVLFLDLDGTVRKGFDELGRFVNTAEDVELFPRMKERLLSWKQRGYRIVAVTNQGGIATGQVTEDNVRSALLRTQQLSDNAFDAMYMCQHHPDAHDPEWRTCFCRKPKIGMLVLACEFLSCRYPDEMYPPHLAMMVGDRTEDHHCALAAGIDFKWSEKWRAEPFTIKVGLLA